MLGVLLDQGHGSSERSEKHRDQVYYEERPLDNDLTRHVPRINEFKQSLVQGFVLVVEEVILGLQVPVHYALGVAVGHGGKHLPHAGPRALLLRDIYLCRTHVAYRTCRLALRVSPKE